MLQLNEIKISLRCQAILSVTEQINGDTAIVSVQEGQAYRQPLLSVVAEPFLSRASRAQCARPVFKLSAGRGGRKRSSSERGRTDRFSSLRSVGENGRGREGRRASMFASVAAAAPAVGTQVEKHSKEGRKPQQPSPPPSFIRRSYKS